jgi:hypothetical protein
VAKLFFFSCQLYSDILRESDLLHDDPSLTTTTGLESLPSSLELDSKYLVIFGLIQRLILLFVEKLTVKSITCETIVELLSETITSLKNQMGSGNAKKMVSYFVSFFQKLSKCNKSSIRAGSIDFISAMLMKEAIPQSVEMTSEEKDEYYQLLLDSLFERLYDSVQVVRFQAVSNACFILEKDSSSSSSSSGENSSFNGEEFIRLFQKFSSGKSFLFEIISFIKNGDRPQFRAKSLSLFSCLISLQTKNNNHNQSQSMDWGFELEVFQAASLDKSPLVRKQMVVSLFQLFREQPHQIKTHLLPTVIPLLSDPCSSVMDKLVSCLFEVFIQSPMDWISSSATEEEGPNDLLAFDLLHYAEEYGMAHVMDHLFVNIFMKRSLFAYDTVSFRRTMNQLIRKCIQLSSVSSEEQQSSSINSSGIWLMMELLLKTLTPTPNLSSATATDLNKMKGEMMEFFVEFLLKQRVTQLQKEERRILRTLNLLVEQISFIPKKNSQPLQEKLNQWLFSDSSSYCSVSLIAPLITLLYEFMNNNNASSSSASKKTNSSGNDVIPQFQEWVSRVFQLAVDNINNQNNNSKKTKNQDYCLLFGMNILGALAMLGFQKDDPPELPMFAKSSSQEKLSISWKQQQPDSAKGSAFHLSFPKFVLEFLLEIISNKKQQPQPEQKKNNNLVRTAAILTLGKFCLRSQKLCREYLPLFLSLLVVIDKNHKTNDENTEVEEEECVKLNALHVLSDLALRYTHIFNNYLSEMMKSLSDRSWKIRKMTFLMISNLILQDYMKWKPNYIFDFLSLLIDENQEISEIAKKLILKTFPTKFPDLLKSSYSSIFLALNHCLDESGNILHRPTNDTTANNHQSTVSSSRKQPKTLPQVHRFLIYSSIAQEFTDEQKLEIIAKLVNDILVPAVDSDGQFLTVAGEFHSPLSAVNPKNNRNNNNNNHQKNPFESAVDDVLLFLKGNYLQIGGGNGNGRNQSQQDALAEMMDEEANNNNSAPASLSQVNAAHSKVNKTFSVFLPVSECFFISLLFLSQILKTISKQQVINQILPTVLSLKRVLEKMKSPLQKSAMEYLVFLFTSHKTEVETVLQFDPVLQAEIEFDLKQYERMNAAKKVTQELSCSSLLVGVEGLENQTPVRRRRPSSSAGNNNNNNANNTANNVMFSPFLDQTLATSSLKKPTLKKNSPHHFKSKSRFMMMSYSFSFLLFIVFIKIL